MQLETAAKSLTKAEREIFLQEIEDMKKSGAEIDIQKAVHNARYLAEIDRRIATLENEKNCIKFTAEEWANFVNGQKLS